MSSNSDNTTKEWRDETSTERRDYLGMLRRMAVKLTQGATWQVIGHLLLDGKREARDAELFGGTLGFYSRPVAGAAAEAIVWNREGADPVIIATRDEDLRKLFALNQGETAMCNRATIVLCKPNGTVEIRTPGGTAAFLATKADLDDLKDAISGAATVAGDGGAAFKANVLAALAGWPAGTTVLKAQ